MTFLSKWKLFRTWIKKVSHGLWFHARFFFLVYTTNFTFLTQSTVLQVHSRPRCLSTALCQNEKPLGCLVSRVEFWALTLLDLASQCCASKGGTFYLSSFFPRAFSSQWFPSFWSLFQPFRDSLSFSNLLSSYFLFIPPVYHLFPDGLILVVQSFVIILRLVHFFFRALLCASWNPGWVCSWFFQEQCQSERERERR